MNSFDWQAFARALDFARYQRKQSWRDVSRETSVNPSTLTRLQQGKKISVDACAALASWAGTGLDRFVADRIATATEQENAND